MTPLVIKKALLAVEGIEPFTSSRRSHEKWLRLLNHLVYHMDIPSQRVMYQAGKARFYLPSTKQIARRVRLNYWTVRKFIRELGYMGLVQRTPSKVYAKKRHGQVHYRRDAFSLKFTHKFFKLLKIDFKLLGQSALYGARKVKKIVGRAKMQQHRKTSDAARILKDSVYEFIQSGQLKSAYAFVEHAIKTKQIEYDVLEEAFPGAVELYKQQNHTA